MNVELYTWGEPLKGGEALVAMALAEGVEQVWDTAQREQLARSMYDFPLMLRRLYRRRAWFMQDVVASLVGRDPEPEPEPELARMEDDYASWPLDTAFHAGEPGMFACHVCETTGHTPA